jgi:hypothetical protein
LIKKRLSQELRRLPPSISEELLLTPPICLEELVLSPPNKLDEVVLKASNLTYCIKFYLLTWGYIKRNEVKTIIARHRRARELG